MRLTGDHEFESPRATIRERLLEAELLEACLPGAKRVERMSEGVYEVDIERILASIRVDVELTVEIESDDHLGSVSIDVDGVDDRSGSEIRGGGTIDIEQIEGGSLLAYDVSITVTGRLASIGPRLIDRQLASDLNAFFECTRDRIDG